MVVRSCSSAAVLCTARCSGLFSSSACCPNRRASSRMGVTSATTASTTIRPMTKPTTQPVTWVSPACASAVISHPLAEVAYRLEVGVHRGQHAGHGLGAFGDRLGAGVDDGQPFAHVVQMHDDPPQCDGGESDD